MNTDEPFVRKAKKSDFDCVKHFIKEHYEREFPELSYESIRKGTEASYKTHVGNDGTFVLVLGNRIIGYLSVGVQKDKKLNLREGELYMIHIAKDFRGKGYANILMKTADAYFKRKKADLCVITTSVTNDVSQSLYKKYGYVPWRITFRRLNK
jgi:ribosomal protein S18 acetylase RimI-like enzyme